LGGGFTVGGHLGQPVEIDLPLGIDDADHRLVEFDHVEHELRLETHVGVDEQQVRGVGLVEPVRQQEVAAFDDVRIGDRREGRRPFVALERPHQPKQALDVGGVENLAVGGRAERDLDHGRFVLRFLNARIRSHP
jgi:hypothetical protein